MKTNKRKIPVVEKVRDMKPVKGAAAKACRKQWEGSTLPNTGPLAPPRA